MASNPPTTLEILSSKQDQKSLSAERNRELHNENEKLRRELSSQRREAETVKRKRTPTRGLPKGLPSDKQAVRRFVDNLKSENSCKDCEDFYPPCAMQFDHLPGFQKVANISSMVQANVRLDVIEEEIAKCDLVCANCHAIRGHNRRKKRK